MEATALNKTNRRPLASKLRIAAGWSMVVIAGLHTAFFSGHPYWSEWFDGSLRRNEASDESLGIFWALPGGFVATLLLLGLLVIRLGRSNQVVPGYIGWVTLAWAGFCVVLVGPSGFMLAVVPAALVIIAGFVEKPKA